MNSSLPQFMANPKGQVTLKTVLHEIQEAGTVFSLKFRKEDGNISIKSRLKKNPTAAKPAPAGGTLPQGEGKPVVKDLKNIQRNMNRSGALLLYDCIKGHTFEVKIRRLVEFNGMEIFHNY